MTDDKPPGALHPWQAPRFAGVPADQRLLAGGPELVRSVIETLLERVPTYRQLPVEQLSGDISRVVERSIRAFGQVLRTGQPPGPRELDAVRESAARRAEEGVPLDAVLTAYHLGVRVCWEAVVGAARQQDMGDVLRVDQIMLDFLQRITEAAAAGYFEERQTMADDQHAARHALLSALLNGAPVQEAAARAGIRLPTCYLVLSLNVADHPDEAAPGVDATIAARRKLRRLRVELERRTRGTALSLLTAIGGVALIPCDTPHTDLSAADWRRQADLVDRMAQMAGADVIAGATAAPPEEIAPAVALVREVCAVARAFHRPAGLYRLDDLLLEYQMSRPSRARDQLADLLTSLEANPELLSTLRTHLDHDLNRRDTARALHLHPNTVDYRLRRIAVITGLDPGRPADLLRIGAALAARSAQGR